MHHVTTLHPMNIYYHNIICNTIWLHFNQWIQINSQYSSRDTHPGTHLKTRHGVDATKHPGIQLINRNHVDSTTEPEIQLINTIPPNRPGIKPDFWNFWSLSKTTENIKTDDMPTTPPPNHQVKGEGIILRN